MLTEQFKSFIKQDAINKQPQECCGLIVGDMIVSCNNISKTPEKSFIIANEEIYKHGIDNILGFYHSHKDYNEFSLADIAFSEKTKKNCILYIINDNLFKEYEPKGMKIPYINRPMFPGFLDCLSLVQDYYERELNIKFKEDINHPLRYVHDQWITDNKELINKYGRVNVLEDYLLNNGFIKNNDLKKHSILLFELPKLGSPSHVAIYLGNNQVLHHFSEFSEVSIYNNAYKRFTVGIFNHNSLI